jgi:hypothetical protein
MDVFRAITDIFDRSEEKKFVEKLEVPVDIFVVGL